MKNSYQIEHIGDGSTTIRAQGYEPELPTLVAWVKPDGDFCKIYIAIGDDLTAITTIRRGKAFAIRVAKFMLKGCLSRMGKHRRASKNRAAKRAKEEEAI